MDKKLINEDIKNMKYLFGYKPGRVISEQDIDYTTEDFSQDEIDGEMEEGYRYDDVDDVNPDDFEDDFSELNLDDLGFNDDSELDEDMFAGWDEPETFESRPLTKRHKLDLDDKEQDMDTGEELYPSFSSDRKFMGMSKSMGDMNADDEDTLFEQEEPENDRYMFFSNLEQIHRQMGILLEKDPEMIHSILENGHDWAQDHIATAKESIDQVFDFIMNEEKGDDNNI
jgi:hypothetical protein